MSKDDPRETGEVESFRCVLCETSLQSKQELQEHFRKHANGEIDAKGNPAKHFKPKIVGPVPSSRLAKVVNCDVCHLQFASVTLAINHKYKQHPKGQSNHHCGFCGKQFPLGECLEMHIRSDHKNDPKSEQQYKCKECGALFHSVTAVDFHVKNSHKRITTLLTPTATLPPSKKIKVTNNGEHCSVFNCHLCGCEYMVKFNLQKHLEGNHTQAQRDKPPEQLIKCSLCDAMFYSKKAYDNHNLNHRPDDLYILSEQDRSKAVTRVDCDFDMSRVPTVLENLETGGGRKRPRIKKIIAVPTHSEGVKCVATTNGNPPLCGSVDQPNYEGSTISNTTASLTEGRNRALVDSDTECRSDTSDESEGSEDEQHIKVKKIHSVSRKSVKGKLL